ncbi:alpha/beta fold hydrolase [Borrelia coriaceae]|uniref:Carboxylesterase n=1 Tax=Borrelia coriaceae ATCC 43381 TaxID=1408429 RepID=W5SUG1_9SPIR|nr:alpha/beta fold hydrolase [Borrelia coriaceae]AHH10834.1 Carboxylesterase [Borrelia coriaceae ATCC 43381]UPA16491.1 alpha/beta fold hydrolase [Borrelia coriaceae]
MNIKNTIFIFIFLLLLAVVGPRMKFRNEFEQNTIPNNLEDLDQYLLIAESKFNLEANTQKEIIWNDTPKRTEYSVVYIHGFGASKNEIYPTPNNIAKALNANIFFTRLKGHGIDNKDAFKDVNTKDWLKDIDEAIQIGQSIGEKLILIGTSNGGACAIWALKNYPDKIHSAVLVSPNIYPKDKRTSLVYYPWGRQIAYLITGGYNKLEIRQNKRIEHEEVTPFYSQIQQIDSIIAMMGLVKLINDNGFNEIKTPLTIAYSPNDPTVDSMQISKFINEYGGHKKTIPITLIESLHSHLPVGNHSYRSAQNTSYLTKYAVDFIKNIKSK